MNIVVHTEIWELETLFLDLNSAEDRKSNIVPFYEQLYRNELIEMIYLQMCGAISF